MGALVLSRDEGEIICIGDNIRVQLVRADRGRARLSISAPPDIPVHRQELKERLDAEGHYDIRRRRGEAEYEQH